MHYCQIKVRQEASSSSPSSALSSITLLQLHHPCSHPCIIFTVIAPLELIPGANSQRWREQAVGEAARRCPVHRRHLPRSFPPVRTTRVTFGAPQSAGDLPEALHWRTALPSQPLHHLPLRAMALLQAQARSALGRLEPRPLPFPMANMMLTRTGSTTLPFAAGVTSLPWKSCLDSL